MKNRTKGQSKYTIAEVVDVLVSGRLCGVFDEAFTQRLGNGLEEVPQFSALNKSLADDLLTHLMERGLYNPYN
ncbi:MAG: hypothetical protein ABFE13_17710 [Phycisphaerales bacterium]